MQVATAVLLWSTIATIATPTTHFDSITYLSNPNATTSTTRINFGSCHKTKYDTQVWTHIQANRPSVFWWTGDSIYTNRSLRRSLGDLQALASAYDNMTNDVYYSNFTARANNIVVEGVWDDHDYGVNDGGKHVSQKKERQALFLQFLNTSNAQQMPPHKARRQRNGAYSHHRYVQMGTQEKTQEKTEQKGVVDVIFLDTRSHRDNHWWPSLGGTAVPMGAVLATFTRLFSHVIGVRHEGDVLGEEQWQWLEASLRASSSTTANITVVVSSIQVFTLNPSKCFYFCKCPITHSV